MLAAWLVQYSSAYKRIDITSIPLAIESLYLYLHFVMRNMHVWVLFIICLMPTLLFLQAQLFLGILLYSIRFSYHNIIH